MKTLEDTDAIGFGKYKGTLLANVPASYLIWCYDNDRLPPDVRFYVRRNYDVLLKEIKDESLRRSGQRS